MEFFIVSTVLLVISVTNSLSTGGNGTSPCEHCTNDSCQNNECTFGCQNGYFGATCTSPCHSGCKNNTCFKAGSNQGQCIDGCVDGFWGDTCRVPCSAVCTRCNRGNGSLCEECGKYHYGVLCKSSCYQKCPDFGCDSDGKCRSCSAYCQCVENNVEDCAGDCFPSNGTCKHGCKVGHHGEECEHTCNEICAGNICDRKSGKCINGCYPGFYSDFCVFQCSSNCILDLCDQDTGTCSVNCKLGFYGSKCNEICDKNCLLRQCNRESGFCLKATGTYVPQDTTDAAVTDAETSPDSNTRETLYFIIGPLVTLILCCIVGGILFYRFYLIKSTYNKERRETVHSTEKAVSRSLPDPPEEPPPGSYHEINEEEMIPRESQVSSESYQLYDVCVGQAPRSESIQSKPYTVRTQSSSDIHVDDAINALIPKDDDETESDNQIFHPVPEVIQHEDVTRHLMSNNDLVSSQENTLYRKSFIGRHDENVQLCVSKHYLQAIDDAESNF